MAAETDRLLFSRIAEGDEVAFAEYYQQMVPQLLPFVTKSVRSDAIADEVIQETFLRLWISRDKLREVENPGAWVFRIASNICYSHIRRLMLERGIVKELAGSKPGHSEETTEMTDAYELSTIIQRAISQLPAQRKKIYLLSRRDGKTIAEIAEELNISPSTVKNTLHTALESIREALREHGYDIPIVCIILLFS